MQCTRIEVPGSDIRLESRLRVVEIRMEGKAAEASGKSAEQRRAERRQKAVIGEIFLSKKLIVERETSIMNLRTASRFLSANSGSR